MVFHVDMLIGLPVEAGLAGRHIVPKGAAKLCVVLKLRPQRGQELCFVHSLRKGKKVYATDVHRCFTFLK